MPGCNFMVLPPMDNSTHLARSAKKKGSDIKSWVRFSGMTKIFFFFERCTIRVRSSAYYSAYKNGRMVVGGRPNVAIESAVARCQLLYELGQI